MIRNFRSQIVLAAALLLAGAMSFAEDGAATYKAKCAMCHGPAGAPSAGMAKAMGIKPVSNPAMKALTAAQIEATVKSGHGKMKPDWTEQRADEGRSRVFQDPEVDKYNRRCRWKAGPPFHRRPPVHGG